MRPIKFRVWNGERWVYLNGIYNMPQPEYEGDDYQFIGLLDKNGKEIYEGDIVKIKDDWEEYGWKSGEVGYIVFEKFFFGISLPSQNKPGTRYTVYADLNGGSDCEVIGNIYENPELLTQ